MTPLLSLMRHPLAQTLGWTLLHFLWQGAALGLLAWLALALLRRASARARYGMACAFLVLLVAAPVGTFLALQPQAQAPAPVSVVALSQAATMPALAAAAIPPLAQRLKVALDPSLPWLLAGWAAGVLLLSARFLGGWLRVQRLRRRSATAVSAEWHLVLSRLCRELKLSRTVRLLQSAAVEVPTALGWLRPVILLPACALTGLAPVQLEAILAHELAHIRRGDFLVNLLQSLVEVLLFYHPAVWWLSARIRAERELCCDDVAADLCGDPLVLARALTDLEALRQPVKPTPTHLALAANGGSLMHRVRHLLHPALPITSGARATALAVLAASLLGAAGVALQDKEPTPKATPNTRMKVIDDGRQLDIQMKGTVLLNAEAPDPVQVSGDGSFRLEERKGGKTRTFVATRAKQTYAVDGQEQALDATSRDWLRAAVRETAKAQAGREKARKAKVEAEDGKERVVELRLRHRDGAGHELEAHARALEAAAQELEHRAQSGPPEEKARLQAEADRVKAEGDKLRAAGQRLKAERERIQNDPELQALIAKAREEGRKVRMEVLAQHGEGPDTVIIRKDGEGKDHVVKRFKLKREGEPGEAKAWNFEGFDGDFTTLEGLDQDLHIPPIHIPPIHIPRIHVQAFAHGEGEDPKAEMAELQAELKALQTRLDQLQKQLATTPKPPRPPKPPAGGLKPLAPLPAPPPPPPAPRTPPAPPAVAPPPAPPAPPAPSTH